MAASISLLDSTREALADRYLDRLAAGWQQRNLQGSSHVKNFSSLLASDSKLIASLRALIALGRYGQVQVQQRLEEPLTRGEIFALLAVSLQTLDLVMVRTCLDVAQTTQHLLADALEALAWASTPNLRAALDAVQSEPLHDILLLKAAATRPDWAQHLAQHRWRPRDPHAPGITAAQSECFLYSEQTYFAPAANTWLEASAPYYRWLGAEVLLAHPGTHSTIRQRAQETLQTLALSSLPDARRAALQTLAGAAPRALSALLPELAHGPDTRIYIEALGWSGHSEAIPLLIDHLDSPQYRRIAGASLSMLTGSLPAFDRWQAPPEQRPTQAPDTSDAIPPSDPDADLPTPHKTAFEAWWSRHRTRFPIGTGYLGGTPITPTNVLQVLRDGRLAWRHLAARHWQRMSGGARPHLTVPANLQRQRLAVLNIPSS